MDMVQHGSWGVYITMVILKTFGILTFGNYWIIPVLTISWILGAFFDIYGYAEGLIKGIEYRWTGIYADSHRGIGIWKTLKYIPYFYLHYHIDKPWHFYQEIHGQTGWKPWGHWLNYVMWAILITLFYIILFVNSAVIILTSVLLTIILFIYYNDITKKLDEKYNIQEQ